MIDIRNLTDKFSKDIDIVKLVLQNSKEEKTGFQSIALAYFTFMSIIPILAVVLLLTDGFGISGYIKNFLENNFETTSGSLASLIMISADNIIETSKSGLAGVISALMFVWTILWMMNRIEKVFNDIWHVNKSRNFFFNIGVDIALLILLPFMMVILISGSVVYSHVLDIMIPHSYISDRIISILGWLLLGGVIIFAFSAMYKFVPSCKVKYKYALKAAILAGSAFTILQYLYLETTVLVTRLNAVYGAIAAVYLFLMWLRYGWLVIVFGAQFSYSFQMVENNQIEQL